MILDSSAVVAVFLAEPNHKHILARIKDADLLAIGAPTLLEAAMVLTARLQKDCRADLDAFLRDAQIEIVPFGREHVDAAIDAFDRYGKGRHPAALNFGDCLAYAVAHVSGLPLLYVGEDFRKTDCRSA